MEDRLEGLRFQRVQFWEEVLYSVVNLVIAFVETDHTGIRSCKAGLEKDTSNVRAIRPVALGNSVSDVKNKTKETHQASAGFRV